LDYKALAKGLIEKLNAPSDGSDKDAAKTEGEGATDGKAKGKVDTALPEPTKIPDEGELKKRAEDLKERQKKLDYKPTAEEQGRLAEMKDDAALKAREKKLKTPAKATSDAEKKLDALEQEQKETKALEDREKKLKQTLSPEQQKKKDELDDLDDEKKDAEALKDWNRKRSKIKAPAGKAMKDLLKGF
jgi:DNA repair exonuclease SbcCD ATPase subunit